MHLGDGWGKEMDKRRMADMDHCFRQPLHMHSDELQWGPVMVAECLLESSGELATAGAAPTASEF